MEASNENHNPIIISKGQWQWLSNKSNEPEWESFSLAHNYLIEKAYYDQQKEVTIDDSIISLRQMIQKKTGDKVSQTPIRRINWKEDEEDADRCERYFETELPQPVSKVSRSLGDFLHFFSKESPEISQFMELFQELEKRNDLNGLNNQIVPKLCDSLQEELNKEQSTFMTSKIKSLKKKMQIKDKENDKKIIMSLRKEFTSFEEFYGQILQTYTINSLLYRNLNNYIKTESWSENKHLLPYAFCLCQAFLNQRLNTNTEIQETKSLILYRGTALDESQLRIYDLETREDLSWHSITSTTKTKEIAEKFMYKSVDLKNNKYPVMFIIEVPNSANYLKWMDVHQYSVMPSEDEVLLAPGSTFTLEEVWKNRNRITTIRMKLKENEKNPQENEFLEEQIKLEVKEEPIEPDQTEKELINSSHMIQTKGKDLKIMCLEGQELLQALQAIPRKNLVQNIEFHLCAFDRGSLEELLGVLPKLKGIKIVKFISCNIKDIDDKPKKIPKSTDNFNDLQIEIIDTYNFHKILSLNREDHKYWQFLESIDISFRKLNDDGLHDLCSEALQYFTQLKSLALNFNDCSEIRDRGVISLSQGLENMSQLTSLELGFEKCNEITAGGVNRLSSQGLKHLTQLISLEMNFKGSGSFLKDSHLCSEGLGNLTQLRSLKIYFKNLALTGEFMKSLELKNFTQLTSLTLDCSFPYQELRHLFQLKSLSLFFSGVPDTVDCALTLTTTGFRGKILSPRVLQ